MITIINELELYYLDIAYLLSTAITSFTTYLDDMCITTYLDDMCIIIIRLCDL